VPVEQAEPDIPGQWQLASCLDLEQVVAQLLAVAGAGNNGEDQASRCVNMVD
jgi:hypothetical protein